MMAVAMSGIGGRSRVEKMKMMNFFLLSLVSLLFFWPMKASALYGPSSAVKVLNAEQFQKQVVDSNGLFIVEFFAPWCGHCKALVPEYEKAAKAMESLVTFVAVEDKTVMKNYGVSGFPTIKAIIGQGGKKPKAIDYSGNRTAQHLTNFAVAQIKELVRLRLGGKEKESPASEVVELTHDNFDKLVMADVKNTWFIKFYAPWCGHCKAMAKDWEDLASMVKGKIKIAKVDASQDRVLAARFGIQGFPTLKVFPAGKKADGLAQPYEGPRQLKDLHAFAMTYYQVTTEAEQLVDEEQWEKCNSSVCVIAFLPHIIDSGAETRKAYLKDINELVRASATMPVTFFWSQGGDQFELEEKLQMAFGFPALVAVNLEKQKYTVHRGNFEKESINSFLTGLMAGQVPVDPLPASLPKLKKVEKWDGKDAPPVAVEESEEL